MLALEQTLFDPIASFSMPTFGAFLRSISGVNKVDRTSSKSSFVFQKGFKPEEAPAVNPKSLFFSKFFTACANVCQIFKDKCSSLRNTSHNPFGNDMVHISPKTVLLRVNFAEVPFGGCSSFGLQSLSQSPIPIYNFSYMSSSKELIVRSDGNLFDSPVNSDDRTRWFSVRNFFLKNNSEQDLTFADKQFGRRSTPIVKIIEIWRCFEGKFFSARNGRNRNLFAFIPNIVRSLVISNAGLFGKWASSLTSFSNYDPIVKKTP